MREKLKNIGAWIVVVLFVVSIGAFCIVALGGCKADSPGFSIHVGFMGAEVGLDIPSRRVVTVQAPPAQDSTGAARSPQLEAVEPRAKQLDATPPPTPEDPPKPETGGGG